MRSMLRSGTFWLGALVFCAAVSARLLPGLRTIDDAYITYRYARHILAGFGFTYNPGEAVLGTTTPLYTFLMVFLGALTGGTAAPFPHLAWLLNSLVDGLTSLLLLQMGRRLELPWAGLGAALVWALNPYSVTFAIGGLETSVYILLLLSTTYAHFTTSHRLAAWLASLCLLTRPDALILLGPLFLDRLWLAWRDLRGQATPWRLPLIEAALFTLPALAWGAFAWFTFGSPIPHSITAKSVAYLQPANTALVILLQRFATPFADDRTLGVTGIYLGIILYPFLYLVGTLAVLRRSPRFWPLAAFPWLYFAAFAIANPLIFRWYNTPPMVALIFFSLAGLERLLSQFGVGMRRYIDHTWGRSAGMASRLLLVLIIPLVFTTRAWTWQPDHGPQRPAPEMAWFKLELLYRQAAERLNGVLAAEGLDAPLSIDSPRLAAGDVGVLGYFTPLRILDTVGLNTPISTHYYPLPAEDYAINYAIPTALILDQRPEYIIILEVYGRKTFLPDPQFQAAYTLLDRLPTDIYGSQGLLIFARKSPTQ